MEVQSFTVPANLKSHVTQFMKDAHNMGIFMERNKDGHYSFIGRFGEHFDHQLKMLFRNNKGMRLDLNQCIEDSGIRLFRIHDKLPY